MMSLTPNLMDNLRLCHPPVNPLLQTIKHFFMTVAACCIVGFIFHLLHIADRRFWKAFVVTATITPFTVAASTWRSSNEEIRQYLIAAQKKREPDELPEIDLSARTAGKIVPKTTRLK